MEERIMYSFKIEKTDFGTLNQWAATNDCPVSWGVRRAIKDFIKNYIEKGVMIPAEEVNKGAAVKRKSDVQGSSPWGDGSNETKG